MADQTIMDQIVQMCQKAITDIITQAGGVGNLLQDEGRMALIQMIASRLTQLGADVDSILGPLLAQAYHQGMTDADAFLTQAGQDATVSGVNKQMHLAGVQAIVADTMADMSACFRTALIMGVQAIDTILEQVKQDIATGMIKGDPSGYTAQKVAQTFAQNGMTAFITKDGKKLPLDFYAQTVTRTKYRVAHTTGAVNRYQESGVYHVKINEHSPTCHICARFQGMVIALDADHAQGFPVAGAGDAKLPPYHPNCQHTARPYVLEAHSQNDINNEKKKWKSFDPDKDVRSQNEKDFYKTEQGIRRVARQEMKEYEMLRATLKGDDLAKLPKNLASYRRMKRKGDAQWQALQQAYKDQMAISNAGGPIDPGTPRKKKGSKTGTSGPSSAQTAQKATGKAKKTSATPKKATTKKSTTTKTKKAQTSDPAIATEPKPVDNMDMSTMSGISKGDQKAVARFDQMADGIEFADRRKTSKFLLDKIPGWIGNIKIAKIADNGHCGNIRWIDGKVHIGEFALRSNDARPIQYQWKTMFHEFFHANLQGLNKPPRGLDNVWTKWEETATECSAFFMCDRQGIDTSTILPSYSNYLTRTLPTLKQLDEFKDCETMKEFGARFMKYRFDPDHATADWTFLDAKARSVGNIDLDDYFNAHYKQHVKQNIDRYTDMIFDSLQQDKTYAVGIKRQIKQGLETGVMSGHVNREIQMILPVLYNEIGVK